MYNVTREHALEAYWRYRATHPIDLKFVEIVKGVPSGCSLYETVPIDEPYWRKTCWSIISTYPQPEGVMLLSSSHITCISKKTGWVIYDGCAQDEG